MSRLSLDPRSWFRSKPSREDELTELAVNMTLNGIIPFLGACCASREEIRLNNPRLGSPLFLAYITGYARAVHGYVEQSSGVRINDGNVGLLATSGVFCLDSFEASAAACKRTQLILGSEDGSAARDAWLLGKQDFEMLSKDTSYPVSGVIEILGIGGPE